MRNSLNLKGYEHHNAMNTGSFEVQVQ
uniref:Uncharacterized protein n=1 Tax=Anguilla anguilla TaxID=7936 RepID=A0A0E9XYR3_ANGAN